MMADSSQHIETLTVSADTSELVTIREFVDLCVRRAGFNEYEINGIILSVDEACSNIMRHAYREEAVRTVTIDVITTSSGIQIEIRDTAASFDSTKSSLPDVMANVKRGVKGGLGILLMTRVMDSIQYTPKGNASDYNILVLTKQRIA